MMNEEIKQKCDLMDSLITNYTFNHGIVTRTEYSEQLGITNNTVSGLFDAGFIVITSTIDVFIHEIPELVDYRQKFVTYCLMKHVCLDNGNNRYIEDIAQNEQSLIDDERIMSVFDYIPCNSGDDGKQTFWIITEYDRKTTTVLDPMDY